MPTALKRDADPSLVEAPANAARVYSICFLDRGLIVPDVTLIDAESDQEAVEYARTSRSFTTREVWDGYRLVAVIPPREVATTRSDGFEGDRKRQPRPWVRSRFLLSDRKDQTV